MKLRKRIRKTLNQKKLSTQIERSLAPSATIDGLDEDVAAHVNHFLATPLPPMEKFSLLTAEDARSALIMINHTQHLLEERIRTVRVLKALCENAKKDEAPN